MLKDVMTDMGFWKDDALICSETVAKRYSDSPGIMICYDTAWDEDWSEP
jgi:Holliday junction resolvase RusA-like endonuclease